MLLDAYAGAVQAGGVLSGAASLITIGVAFRSWKKHGNPIDLAYAVGVAGWLVYLLAANLSTVIDNPWTVFATYASYQTAMVGTAFFLLVSASITRFRIHALWMIQGMAGLLLIIAWNVWAEPLVALRSCWVVLNLVCVSAVALYLGLNLYREGTYRCWLVFGGSLLALGIFFQDLLTAARPGITLSQYFYASFLLVVWLLITNRAGRPESPAVLTTSRTHSTWENVTGFFPDTDFSAPAVNNERRRIAQDLHDGVASQLVNVLATLDTRVPEQQAVVLALEQCLLDLKIMVDSIDSAEGSVVDALGSLRYRVQHALDKMGIRMVWMVDMDGPLLNFSGERAQQVLRITQECLSNVMRHSHASVVEVICRYQPESESLLLEVHDNGCGIASSQAGRPTGKGLRGLRRRANKLGGKLQIATKPQKGTFIRLLVPLHRPAKVAESACGEITTPACLTPDFIHSCFLPGSAERTELSGK